MPSKKVCALFTHENGQSDSSESFVEESEEESLSSIGDDDSSSREGGYSDSDDSIVPVLSDNASDDASGEYREYLRPRTRSANPVYTFRSEETDKSDLSSVGDDDSSSWEGDYSESDDSIVSSLSDDDRECIRPSTANKIGTAPSPKTAGQGTAPLGCPRPSSANKIGTAPSPKTDANQATACPSDDNSQSDQSSINDDWFSKSDDSIVAPSPKTNHWLFESDDSIVSTLCDDARECIRSRTANKIEAAPSPKTDANQGTAPLACPNSSTANKKAPSPKTDDNQISECPSIEDSQSDQSSSNDDSSSEKEGSNQPSACPSKENSQSDQSSRNDDSSSEKEGSKTHVSVSRKPAAPSPSKTQKKRRGQRQQRHVEATYREKFDRKRANQALITPLHRKRNLKFPKHKEEVVWGDFDIAWIGDCDALLSKLGCQESIRKILGVPLKKVISKLDKAHALFHPDGHYVDQLGDHRLTYHRCIYYEPGTRKIGMTRNIHNRFRGREERKDRVKILTWDGMIDRDLDTELIKIVDNFVKKIIANRNNDIPRDLREMYRLFFEGAAEIGFRKQVYWALIEMACQDLFGGPGNVGEQFTCDEETNQNRRDHVKKVATEFEELLKPYVGRKITTWSSWPSGISKEAYSSQIVAVQHMIGDLDNWSDFIEEPPVPHEKCKEFGDYYAFHKYSDDTLQKYVDKNLPKIEKTMKEGGVVFMDRNDETFGQGNNNWLIRVFFPGILKCKCIAVYNGGEFFVFENKENKNKELHSVAIVYRPFCIANHSAGFISLPSKMKRYVALGVLTDICSFLNKKKRSWESPEGLDTMFAAFVSELTCVGLHENPMNEAAAGRWAIMKVGGLFDGKNALTENNLRKQKGTPAVTNRARNPKEQLSYVTEETRTIESLIISKALNIFSTATKDNVKQKCQEVDKLFKEDNKANSTYLKRWDLLKKGDGTIVERGSVLEAKINAFLVSIRKNKGNRTARGKTNVDETNRTMEALFEYHTTEDTAALVPLTGIAKEITKDDPRFPKGDIPVYRNMAFEAIRTRTKHKATNNSKRVKRAVRAEMDKYIGGTVNKAKREDQEYYPNFVKVWCTYAKENNQR